MRPNPHFFLFFYFSRLRTYPIESRANLILMSLSSGLELLQISSFHQCTKKSLISHTRAVPKLTKMAITKVRKCILCALSYDLYEYAPSGLPNLVQSRIEKFP